MKEKIRKIDRLTIVKSMAFLMVMLLIASLAWHCDDAYHGFVMARNLVNGNGLVYNVGERVNASTCPLFTLLVAGVYAILGGGGEHVLKWYIGMPDLFGRSRLVCFL